MSICSITKKTSRRKEHGGGEGLRIVHVAPDFYPVPPLNYGGIERMIYALVEESVNRGHEVYLYAREGSKTSAQLIPYHHEPGRPEHIAAFVSQTLPERVDIIHDHTHLSVIGKLNLTVPTVCTIHDSLNNDVEHPVYLSKRALEHVGKGKGHYVYNGIDLNEYPLQEEKEDYLLFLGVISAHKGIHHALEIAEKTNY
jgi:glycosyltransferase involved in cell wall biosynthesis